MKTEQVIGIPVDAITYESILADVPQYFRDEKKLVALSINPQIALEAQNYPELITFINQGVSHRIPDGIGIVLVSKLRRGAIKERVAGIELMTRFLEYAEINQKRAFFYGAKPEVLEAAIENLQQIYPKLQIVGAIDGYTKKSDWEIIAEMNESKTDFIFVGLGFPKQELWLAEHLDQLEAVVYQDVGGSFDVFSGFVKRAPDIFIKLNLEWLYRSLANPKRIGRIFQLPVFLWKAMVYKN